MVDEAIDLVLSGRVQGVGFRPFVYRLAHEHGIHGWVRNTIGRVEIHAEGKPEALENFRYALIQQSPPLSEPQIEYESPSVNSNADGFFIRRSEGDGDARIHSPPDQYLCQECEQELHDPTNRRYQYPFINCTQCGPRYTIITAMPYDRANTSMDSFHLCEACRSEYEDPASRRFHAEPNACEECGPRLSYFESGVAIEHDNTAALDMAVTALRRGRVIAVKGVGGYHLMCDAANELAVSRLRKNKHRPHKPLALMAPAAGKDRLDGIRRLVVLDKPKVAAELLSQSRPIILLPRQPDAPVCREVAPDLDEFGVMLPPSPMHELLAEAFGSALVATSGNISGEPVLTDDAEADRRLGHIAEGWLVHDREIVRPADDSVKRQIGDTVSMIRLGRGIAPLERQLPSMTLDHAVMALGGHLKNTVTLAWQDRLVISPHIGDLSAYRSMQVFQQVIEDLQRLYQVNVDSFICDAHPQYASSRWANEQEIHCVPIQHHVAHASAIAADTDNEDDLMNTGLVFTWDGVGYGDDGRLWGGEAFVGRPGDWQRVSSVRNFRLTGGDRVPMEPWRSAAALHWELEETYPGSEAEKLAHVAWQNGLNSFETSAIGRLFDAAAAMVGLVHTTSHEGEAPMRLEAIAEDVHTNDMLPLVTDGAIERIDWEPLFYVLKDKSRTAAQRAGYLHRVLANTITQIAQQQMTSRRIDYVGLTGGVFQNRRLSELVMQQLGQHGIPVRLASGIPANDGGISYGQVIEYAARNANAD